MRDIQAGCGRVLGCRGMSRRLTVSFACGINTRVEILHEKCKMVVDRSSDCYGVLDETPCDDAFASIGQGRTGTRYVRQGGSECEFEYEYTGLHSVGQSTSHICCKFEVDTMMPW